MVRKTGKDKVNIIPPSVDKPSTCNIVLDGNFKDRLLKMLPDFQISLSGKESMITNISGEVKDQSELNGILDYLLNARMPLLSIQLFSKK